MGARPFHETNLIIVTGLDVGADKRQLETSRCRGFRYVRSLVATGT